MTACTHGCADPKMCSDCRRTQIGPASEDPDIRQAWATLRDGLAALFRPYVQAHLLDDLVRRAMAELVHAAGWKPPLRPPPDWLRDARAARSMAAETEERDP